MLYLIVNYAGTKQYEGPITQEMLQMKYASVGYNVYRFNEGRFEYLSAHKWRTRAEGGGWDENGLWKERWDELPSTDVGIFGIS